MRSLRFPAAAVAALVTLTSVALTGNAAEAAGARGYTLYTTQDPAGKVQVQRWNPCQTLTYKVNVGAVAGAAAKRRAVREVKVSIGRLTDASGLRFRFGGRTAFVPRTGNWQRQPADLVVAFVKPSQTNYPIGGFSAGYGGVRSTIESRTDGSYRVQVVRGFVVVDHPQTRNWPKALDRRGGSRPALIGHELGHAVGLGHVSDARQLMYPTLNRLSPATYATGDRAGLQKVGRPAGCIR